MKKTLLMLSLLFSIVALVSCNNSNQDTVLNNKSNVPSITEKGMEPFTLGASLIDIPAQGDFYNSVIINTFYDWCEKEGEMSGKQSTESEYKEACKMTNGNIMIEKKYGVAEILKDGDTIMTIDYDGDMLITNITIWSSLFQMENGIHVGMEAPDLIKNYDAHFVTQNEWQDGGTYLSKNVIIDIPSLPKHIIIFSECNSKIEDYMRKQMEQSGNYNDFNYVYKLPSELINNNVVSKIKIRNTDFDCYEKYNKDF